MPFRATVSILFLSMLVVVQRATWAQDREGESYFFIPPGFSNAGQPITLDGPTHAQVRIEIRDKSTGQPTACRLNVVGPDGNFYQPAANRLSKYALTGEWPQKGAWGNRRDKAPYRYLGRYFYATGQAVVNVPAGLCRVEAFKGFEFRPVTQSVQVASGQAKAVVLELERVAPLAGENYFGGDTHLHFARQVDEDDAVIFDLLEAEDVWYGTTLGYNEPAGPYFGTMEKMDSPQFRQLGEASTRSRGRVSIQSGQEYRSTTYGHLNLYLRNHLVFPGQNFNADTWPVYGHVGAETKSLGGASIHAHGGYALEVYADAALETVDAVELLQFGVYRGIGLEDWYHMLNTGYRFPCVGASDFPACRFLADCRTYAWVDHSTAKTECPSTSDWLRAVVSGQSFVTTGPLLLIEVNGKRPGERLNIPAERTRLGVTIRVRCEVTKIEKLDLIVNGNVARSWPVPADRTRGEWFEVHHEIQSDSSCWIASRAYSLTPGGQPDAESHTNPVYVYHGGRAPYSQQSLDQWVERIDRQIENHTKRTFPEKAKVLAYFQNARDVLLRIRERQGLKSDESPSALLTRTEANSPESLLSTGGLPGTNLAQDVSRLSVTDAELKAFLQPVPPKPAAESVKQFDVAHGFRMELVAAEPLVYDPIAAAIDENGSMYVCEMRDYPFKPNDGVDPIGTVRLLRDVDGDGRFDQAHVFADKLLWAAGVVPWQGGVYVAAPPDIWYLKDTDGDFRADFRRRVFSGFGTDNQQAMLNNLQFGMDHKIYGSTAGNGGSVRHGNNPEAAPVQVSGRDFRFDPRTEVLELTTGTVQFGNTFDDWGNRFVCSESQPLQHVVFSDHYLARNPFVASASGIFNVAPGPVPIFRISPVERWRQIRSGRRILKNERAAASAGASHHVIDAAAGVTVYRGGAYPPEFYGNVFVGDGQNNLVHRRILSPDGVTFRSQRAEERTEFVRSPDIWFRPVNFLNAPDGTLYCLDMSREVLESIHIPLDVAQHLDFASGRDFGRIYRIAPPGFVSPAPPNLSQLTTGQLVEALKSPHGWWRDTAHRLIFERQDRSVAPNLKQLALSNKRPESRILALWSLQGLDSLDGELLISAVEDDHPEVRVQALRLAEPFLAGGAMSSGPVVRLAQDDNIRVRFQAAFSLGELRGQDAARVLAQMLRREGGDRWMRTAVLSSVVKSAPFVLDELLRPTESNNPVGWDATTPDNRKTLGQLAMFVGARNELADVERVLELVRTSPQARTEELGHFLLLELCRGVRRSGRPLKIDAQKTDLQSWWTQRLTAAESASVSATADLPERLSAIELLRAAGPTRLTPILTKILERDEPEPIHVAAIQALSDLKPAQVSSLILPKLTRLSPDGRRAAFDIMLSRDDLTLQLLTAADQQFVSLLDLELARRELLTVHSNDEIRQLAMRLFKQEANSERQAVVAAYQESLTAKGDSERGRVVFENNCSACHQLEGKGFAVGPNLASSAVREPAALLVHILDPNRYVLPNYLQYVVVDTSGRSFSGMIVSQTATSVTLKREKNESLTILRGDIDTITCVNKSLMPEGLEKTTSVSAMSDLLAYLGSAVVDPNAARDFGTHPGLIEPRSSRISSP